jgi:hypothetical protein
MTAPTIASAWADVSGQTIGDDLLEWVPDVFALTETLLQRSEAYRFAVSPPANESWPPADAAEWHGEVAAAAEQWCAWVIDRTTPLPALVAEEWAVLRLGVETPLTDVAGGRAWRVCRALLTLHAVADEACAGMGVSVPTKRGPGRLHRARARELLARKGSLTRIPRHRLRVLPKVRTPSGGISFRSLSRYACVRDADVDVIWHRAPVRRAGAHQHANILLLPWPLRIRARDFKPIEASVQRTEREPFGMFEFTPAEDFDLGLADRVLSAARDEVDTVDVVVLPETAVPETAIEELEALLARHGVSVVVAGIRESPCVAGQLVSNWVHIGVFIGERWWHYRQNKHHRWFLDRNQIDQYGLGGALHPSVRWWESMAVPPRSVHFLELGSGITVAAVICEDLARLDEVADLMRSVGPTLVATTLLDGPQLASRWTARYASVLADDPGSAVLTLTAYGFVQRSRPGGRPASSVVSLWKDATRGLREIELEPGAHGIVLTVAVDQAPRHAADGRMPVDDVADLLVAGVYQVRATDPSATSPATTSSSTHANGDLGIEPNDLTVLTSWAEAVAEASTDAPEAVDAVLADAAPDAPWRADLHLPEPSPTLAAALARLGPLAAATPQESDPNAMVARLVPSAIESIARESSTARVT